MIYKVGLTGGIGSGKSTVASAFNALGVPTFSADEIAFSLSQKGELGYTAIVKEFGKEILNSDSQIDRATLGDIVFNDPLLKSSLENILHPLIMASLHRQADSVQAPYCVLDIPLLINTDEYKRVDSILVIRCDKATRIARIRHRSGWSDDKIAAVMEHQVPQDQLIKAADQVIDNSGEIGEIPNLVAPLHAEYLRKASG